MSSAMSYIRIYSLTLSSIFLNIFMFVLNISFIDLYSVFVLSTSDILEHNSVSNLSVVSEFSNNYSFSFAENQTLNCPICGPKDGTCSSLFNCNNSCGSILSVNYPLNYSDNHRCRWMIIAPPDHYINLTVNDFDVPSGMSVTGEETEACLFDFVSFFDGSTKKLIGKYCNARKPSKYTLSSFNHLIIDFYTDSKQTGKGFSFSYVLSKFTLSPKLLPLLKSSPSACPPTWSYYKGHCYQAYLETESLQWYKAEEKCSFFGKGRDGHLVSVLDENEMLVVHHFLINSWKAPPYQAFYIGLIDVSKEGMYRWSDNNPMSYTDWAREEVSDPYSESQPDGGAFEDCTILRFDSLHSTAHWHDIPCSLGKSSGMNISLIANRSSINGYICKMDASASSLNVSSGREALYDDVIIKPNETEIREKAVKERYYVCRNLEVISILQRCDGIPNCRDGTDELDGCTNPGSEECLPFQFRCSNGRCISIASTCDFVDDCGDASDEKNCYIWSCKSSEFKCNNGQCIPVSKRCDLLYDCKDMSDEGSICTSKGYCNPATTFQCYFGNCIPLYAVCDRHRDCPGKFHEDEDFCDKKLTLLSNVMSFYNNENAKLFECKSGQLIDQAFRCIFEFDQFGYQKGCRDVSHLRNCDGHICPKDYVKCPESYCIPPRYICDGKKDCVGGEDETRCGSFSCPGQYKCINHSSCVLINQLCDSIRHCPTGDDEWFCDVTCPDNCSCIGLYVDCSANNFTLLSQNIPKIVRKLDLSMNALGPSMESIDFSSYLELVELILQKNNIEIILERKFVHLKNLYKLDLRYNRIIHIKSTAFAGLVRVNSLLLEGNPNLQEIESNAFIGLSKLLFLNISNTKLNKLRSNVFVGLSSLQHLELKFNHILTVETNAFLGLNSVVTLDLRGNEIRDFKRDLFTGLENLRNLYTDSFKFCCLVSIEPFNIPFDRCLPPTDEISDCEDLMSSPIQRYFLWILGVIALMCNLIVVIWRQRTRLYSNKVSSTLILSLGCADFLMGIYLLIIASVDVYYRGHYIEVSDVWRKSYLCKFCGFLSAISSEASVFTLVFISIDRYISICYPLSKYRLTMRLTYKLVIGSWISAFIISFLPLIVQPYFHDQFYSRSGVCLALHITNQNPAGWEYSVAIFLCINLIAFLIIVASYSLMYKKIRESSRHLSQIMTRKNVRERQVGKQMALIVMSNFLCWFPIIIMGLMAIGGQTLPAAVYSWTAVFVLPLNSATNPLVYTFAHFRPSIFTKQRKDSLTIKVLTSSNKINRGSSRTMITKPFKPPYGYVNLINYLRDNEKLEPKHLLQISCSLSEQVKDIHERGYVLGGIDFDNVFVSSKVDERYLRVYLPDFSAFRVRDLSQNDDYAVDIEEYGLLVKKMLRLYHFKRNCLKLNND